MKPTLELSFAFLFGSVSLAAQAVDQYRTQKADPRVWSALPDSCPVQMRAQHAPGGSMVAVAPGRSPFHGVYQRLRLTLIHPDSTRITGARITVHGSIGKALVMPAAPSAQDTSEETRTLDLEFKGADGKETFAEFSAPGFTSVSRIDLESLTYADGSTWTASGPGCHAVPDPFMLLSPR